jgi:phosphoribosylpyrophosphate synthetase
MLVDTCLVLGYLVGRKARRINLISGYLPLSRSDKDEGTTELALIRMIIDMIFNASYARLRRIVSCNLHSPQIVSAGIPGLITEISMARRVLIKALIDARSMYSDSPVTLLLPDENAQKRFEQEIEKARAETGIEFSIICAQKRHIGKVTKIIGLSGDINKINNSVVISLDDEASTLGTTEEAISFIRNRYSYTAFWAAVVHGVLSGNASNVLSRENSPIGRLYLTDTIPLHCRPNIMKLINDKKICVVSWANDLAEVVDHLHWDESIREIR